MDTQGRVRGPKTGKPTVLSSGMRFKLRLLRLFKATRPGRRTSSPPDKAYGLHGKRLTQSDKPRLRSVREP